MTAARSFAFPLINPHFPTVSRVESLPTLIMVGLTIQFINAPLGYRECLKAEAPLVNRVFASRRGYLCSAVRHS